MIEEEAVPKIRPIWLIGGSAAALVLGGCALVSICLAGILIWFTSSPSSNNYPATEVINRGATQPVVVVPTQRTPTQVAPTALPAITSRPISSPAVVLPTQDPSLRPAPDQAVRSYFQFVSQQRYDLTWSMLTDDFKQKFNCCAPGYDFDGYTDWWNSVDYVDFGTVRIVAQTGDRAVVYVETYFVMNTGARSGVDSNPYIEVVYSPTLGSWQFSDKRATP